MKNKIKKLIKNSRVLTDFQKDQYLLIVDLLSKDKKANLIKIFEKEKKEFSKIEVYTQKQKSLINKKYFDIFKQTLNEFKKLEKDEKKSKIKNKF